MSIKNLWPESFDTSNIQTPPVEVLEEQAKLLPKLTNDMVYVHVARTARNRPFQVNGSKVECKFTYSFFLRGKFLDDFLFEVFSLGHNIDIYPAFLHIDEDIRQEIDLSDLDEANQKGDITVYNQPTLEMVIGKILKSNKVYRVITSVMRLSVT